MCCERPWCCLSAAANSSSSSSSATKRVSGQGVSVQSRRVRCEGGAERHQASAPAPPHHCPPFCMPDTRPSDAHSAAAAPRAPPPDRGKRHRRCTGGAAAERPTPRFGGSSHTLPTLTPCLRPLAPRRPDTHSRPPSRSAGRSYPPRPQQGGAPQRHHRCSPHPVDWEMTVNAFSRIPELLYPARHVSLLGLQSMTEGLERVTNPSESPRDWIHILEYSTW